MFKFGVAALAMLACASAVPTLSESQKMFDDFIAKVCGQLFCRGYAQ